MSKDNMIPLPKVEKKPSFELRTNKEGHAVIIIRENGNESAAVLDNQQCKALARNLRGIANANGLNNKILGKERKKKAERFSDVKIKSKRKRIE